MTRDAMKKNTADAVLKYPGTCRLVATAKLTTVTTAALLIILKGSALIACPWWVALLPLYAVPAITVAVAASVTALVVGGLAAVLALLLVSALLVALFVVAVAFVLFVLS